MFKYYVSESGGSVLRYDTADAEFWGLSKNADTAYAGGVSMKMLKLPILGKVWSIIVVMWVGSLDDRAIGSMVMVHKSSCG